MTTPLWTLGRADFVPPVETGKIPATLLERFAATHVPEPLIRLLCWLAPLTSRSVKGRLYEGR